MLEFGSLADNQSTQILASAFSLNAVKTKQSPTGPIAAGLKCAPIQDESP